MWTYVKLDGPRWIKGTQVDPGGPSWAQMDTEGPNWTQVDTIGAKWSQVEQSGSKWSQEILAVWAWILSSTSNLAVLLLIHSIVKLLYLSSFVNLFIMTENLAQSI